MNGTSWTLPYLHWTSHVLGIHVHQYPFDWNVCDNSLRHFFIEPKVCSMWWCMIDFCRHYMVANATMSFSSILSTYPGQLKYVTILVMLLHLKAFVPTDLFVCVYSLTTSVVMHASPIKYLTSYLETLNPKHLTDYVNIISLNPLNHLNNS